MKCPICNELAHICHKGVRDNRNINVYKCDFCGTKFLSDFNNIDYENGQMYETNHMSSLDIEERLSKFYKDDFRRYEMVKDLCTNKKVLDFGCGFGGFISLIKDETSLCEGIELGNDEKKYLFSKGINVSQNINDMKQKYDVITLFHTFEHLDNPLAWLDKFYDYLEDEGKVIIEVPNANDALLELYNCEAFADFTYWSAHIYLYSVLGLSTIINKSGKFEILEKGQVQRYPISNHLYWLAQGKPGGQEVWSNLDNEVLNSSYFQVLRNLEMCDTLFFVLKKKKG